MLKRALFGSVIAFALLLSNTHSVMAQMPPIYPACPGAVSEVGEIQIETSDFGETQLLLGNAGAVQIWDISRDTPYLMDIISTGKTPVSIRRMYSHVNDFDPYGVPHYWFSTGDKWFSSVARLKLKNLDSWEIARFTSPSGLSPDTTAPFDREVLDPFHSVFASGDSMWIERGEYKVWLDGNIGFEERSYRIEAADAVSDTERLWVDIALRGTTMYAVNSRGGVWKFDLSQSPHLNTGVLMGRLDVPKKGNSVRHIRIDDGYLIIHDAAGANGTVASGHLFGPDDSFIGGITNGWDSIHRNGVIITSGFDGIYRTDLLRSRTVSKMILGDGVETYGIAEYRDKYYVKTNKYGVLIFNDRHQPVGRICPWAPRFRLHLPGLGSIRQLWQGCPIVDGVERC
jgi:hypothetical protein